MQSVDENSFIEVVKSKVKFKLKIQELKALLFLFGIITQTCLVDNFEIYFRVCSPHMMILGEDCWDKQVVSFVDLLGLQHLEMDFSTTKK
jgi:hypothetical protein